MDNATLLLQIENAKLAEEDFKNKYMAHRISCPSIKHGLWCVFRQIPGHIFESELILCAGWMTR